MSGIFNKKKGDDPIGHCPVNLCDPFT